MSATLLTDLADGAAAVLDAAAITSLGRALKVYTYEPRDLDVLPAVTIDGPTDFTRVEPDGAESQLGANDWRVTYTLRVYVAVDDPRVASDESRQILGQVIAAIDGARGLGVVEVLDAALSEGSREFVTEDNQRALLIYTCSLRVWALVP